MRKKILALCLGALLAVSAGMSATAEEGNVVQTAGAESIGQVQLLKGLSLNCAPSGIAVMSDGAFLVTDTYGKKIWRVQDGVSTVYAGGESVRGLYGEPVGGYNDAALSESLFLEPWAVAPFLDGWAVADAGNNAVRLLRPDRVETVNGRSASLQMTEMGVAFAHPTGLASDSEGNLYVSDTQNGAVRKVTSAGEVETLVSDLASPTGLFWQGGALYIAVSGGNRIARWQDGTLSYIAGSGEEGYLDGGAEGAQFSSPQGVAVTEDGTVYVADTANGAVRRIREGVVDTLMQGGTGLPSDLLSPTGLLPYDGALYVCDNFSRQVFILPL